MSDNSRAVLVTGTSTGIGRATAQLLVRQGYRVFAGARNLEGDHAPPEGAEPLLLDVTNPDHVAAAVDRLRAACPDGLYALVNNAGMAAPQATELADLDELRALFEVNAVAPLRLIQQCLPLIRAGGGRIVTVTSMNGIMSLPSVGAYSASKFAMEALSDALRVELLPWRIPVSTVRPGQISTPIFDKAIANLEERAANMPPNLATGYSRLMTSALAFARFGRRNGRPPEAVARTVLKILRARWPRARYYVGLDVRGMRFLQMVFIPSLFDQIQARTMGIHRRLEN